MGRNEYLGCTNAPTPSPGELDGGEARPRSRFCLSVRRAHPSAGQPGNHNERCCGERDRGRSSLPGALCDAELLLQGMSQRQLASVPCKDASLARPGAASWEGDAHCSEPGSALRTGPPYRPAKMTDPDWWGRISSFLVKPRPCPPCPPTPPSASLRALLCPLLPES